MCTCVSVCVCVGASARRVGWCQGEVTVVVFGFLLHTKLARLKHRLALKTNTTLCHCAPVVVLVIWQKQFLFFVISLN